MYARLSAARDCDMKDLCAIWLNVCSSVYMCVQLYLCSYICVFICLLLQYQLTKLNFIVLDVTFVDLI